MVTWDTIDCIERNGVITSYSVEFQEEGGADIPGEVMGQSFTASGLTPNTSYTFRVAGVNANGTGPFTENITINTDPTTINTDPMSNGAELTTTTITTSAPNIGSTGNFNPRPQTFSPKNIWGPGGNNIHAHDLAIGMYVHSY